MNKLVVVLILLFAFVYEGILAEKAVCMLIDDFDTGYDPGDTPSDHGWYTLQGSGTFIRKEEGVNHYLEVLSGYSYPDTLNYIIVKYLTDPENFSLPLFRMLPRSAGEFRVDVYLRGKNGSNYFLCYLGDKNSDQDSTDPQVVGSYIIYSLGWSNKSGEWHEVIRNLDADLMKGVSVHFDYVMAVILRGTLDIDDIGLFPLRPIYVDADATGSGDGSSWADAYTELQSALAEVAYGQDIWVSEGVYYPDYDSLSDVHTGNISATFRLVNDVVLYGGFSGTESSEDQRNWAVHPTVLSGDIDHNDLTDSKGIITDAVNIVGSNAQTVVTSSGVTETSVLDGFIITGGDANGSGAGWWNPDCSGGGMYNDTGNPTLTNLTFSGNRAFAGGGLFNSNSSSPMITNAIFNGNTAYGGGGLFNYINSSPTINNVILSRNKAESGAGLYNDSGSNPEMTNVTFSNNTASLAGGSIYNYSSEPKVHNSILWGNNPSEIYNGISGNTIITYSDIEGGYIGAGNINANPLFVDEKNGDVHLKPFSPCIDAGDNLAPNLPITDIDNDDRRIDDPRVTDVGNGTPPVVDMGADEFKPIQPEGIFYVIPNKNGGSVIIYLE